MTYHIQCTQHVGDRPLTHYYQYGVIRLTHYENVPLKQDVNDYLALEVKPHFPDAYIDPDYRDEKDFQIGRVGYEINFNRFLYEYKPPRKLEEIDAELKQVESEIPALLGEMTE